MTFTEFAAQHGFTVKSYEEYWAMNKAERKTYDSARAEMLKLYLLNEVTEEWLLKRGNNVACESYCILIGESEYGTQAVKVAKIMAWKKRQAAH